MTSILYTLLISALSASLVAALLLLLLPLLSKRYTAKSLYIVCTVVLLAFWIPFQLLPSAHKVNIPMPAWTAEAVSPAQNEKVSGERPGQMDPGLGPAGIAGSSMDTSATGAQAVNSVTENANHQDTANSVAGDADIGAADVSALDAGGNTLHTEAGAASTSGTGTTAGTGSYTDLVSPSSTSQTAQPANPGLTWAQAIGAVWLLGTAGILALQGVRHILFLRTVKRWKKPLSGEPYASILLDARKAQNVQKEIHLFVCPSISSPMLVGALKPAILLPDEDLSEEELLLVLRHELTHYHRGDLWVKALMLLTTAMLWWNPLVWLAARATAFYQEASCDEAVTRTSTMEDKRFYSETIIRVIRRQAYPRTALSTSFYGGKNGMKRRILSIMNEGGKRAGVVVCALVFLLTAATGMALSPSPDVAAPDAVTDTPTPTATDEPWVGQTAYVANVDAGGTRLLSVPSVNDWSIPLAAYLNGTPCTVLETRESSALADWPTTEGEDNWAMIAIGGDGLETGIQGFVPLHHLSRESGTLPAATAETAATTATGHVNLYARNEEASPLVNILPSGEIITLLGDLDDWLHVDSGSGIGFIQKDAAKLSAGAEKAFATFLPDRFDFLSREEYNHMIIMDRLVAAKTEENGGLYIDDWPQEDKAWYSQLMETFDSPESMYYVLPEAGDIPEEKAKEAAWSFFAETFGLPEDTRDTYALDGAYLYTKAGSDERLWDVPIGRKGESKVYVTVHPDGEATIREDEVKWYKEWLENTVGWSVSVTNGVATIAEGVRTIPAGALAGRADITAVRLPVGLQRIEEGAFQNCSQLTSIVIPDSVETIGANAFRGCTALTDITLPSGIHYLEEGLLAGCTSLAEVSIPDSVVYIEAEAFAGCTTLTAVSIPGGVSAIGDRAFQGCTSLESATLPQSLVEIGKDAFIGCPEDLSFLTEDGSFSQAWVQQEKGM